MEPLDRERSFAFNSVIVIESLPDKDRTAKALCESVIKYEVMRGNLHQGIYINAYNKLGFIEALSTVMKKIGEGIEPIIHIEAHGSDEGIMTESGEIVDWIEVGTHFRAINKLLKNNLIVVLALCSGVNIYKQIDVTSRAPFLFAVAAEEEVSKGSVETGFNTFYEVFLKQEHFDEAIIALNEVSDTQFYLIDAEKIFHQGWDDYTREYDSVDKIIDKLESMMTEGKIQATEQEFRDMQDSLAAIFNMGGDGKVIAYRWFMMKDLQQQE